MSKRRPDPAERIAELLRGFKLPTMADELVPRLCTAGHEGALVTIAEVLDLEEDARQGRRVERLRRAARLPEGKTFDTFDEARLSPTVLRKIRDLESGDFLDQAINVLAFGLPGVGKSHALAALGHRLVRHGRAVLWTPTYTLIQELLAAKRDLSLPRMLRRLDHFELVILDDIGYVNQSCGEAIRCPAP